MPRKQWYINKRLNQFGDLYVEFETQVSAILEGMTDAELKKVIADCATLTASNVGWGAYRAAPIVARQAQGLLYRRAQKAEEVKAAKKAKGK